MLQQGKINSGPGQSLVYEIRLRGHLDKEWAAWFDDASIRLEESGESVITCRVADQAALFGLLRKVRDLDMPLISVERIHLKQQG